MAKTFERRHIRKLVALRATVAARTGIPTIDCLIRDASAGGCRIISDKVSKLPDEVIIRPQGYDKPLNGRIVWRDKRSAGIAFVTRF